MVIETVHMIKDYHVHRRIIISLIIYFYFYLKQALEENLQSLLITHLNEAPLSPFLSLAPALSMQEVW